MSFGIYLLFFSYLAYFAYSMSCCAFLRCLANFRSSMCWMCFAYLRFFYVLKVFCVLESLSLFLVLRYTITFAVCYSNRKSSYRGIGFPGVLLYFQVLQIFFASIRSDNEHFPMTIAKYIFCLYFVLRKSKADLCWGLWSLQLYRFCSRSCRGLRKEILL